MLSDLPKSTQLGCGEAVTLRHINLGSIIFNIMLRNSPYSIRTQNMCQPHFLNCFGYKIQAQCSV